MTTGTLELSTKVEQRVVPTVDNLRREYSITDVDVSVFLDHFEDRPGGTVLEVGSHDESSAAAAILARAGQRVVAIDLREPNCAAAGKLYQYHRLDFCDLPAHFVREYVGRVDAIFSISAIEHFGLCAYSEGLPNLEYDIIAMRQMWQLLRPGGCAYITVPYGRQFFTLFPHWRVYDWLHSRRRLVGDFKAEAVCFFTSAPALIDGVPRLPGCNVTFEEAERYDGTLDPHVTAFFKLRKQGPRRLAPDGR